MVKFECFHDWALLEEIPRGQTEGGIALPERPAESDEPMRAKVLVVGPGRYESGTLVAPEVKVGDVVYAINVYTPAVPIRLGGKSYVLCKSSSLVGRVPS